MDRLSQFEAASDGGELAFQHVVKYGTGKYAKTELVPQPSDSSDDPLNWPTWKKDLNLFGILFSVAMAGVLKTFLVTVNSTVAINLISTYTAVSALTGTPLIISAFTGVLSLVISQSIGKRMVYLGSATFMLIGIMWNMNVGQSYAQFMGARALQGIGIGAFNTVVLSSIQDMYFEHERSTRVSLYNTVMLGTTWGSPILGGYMAQSAGGISQQFMIISIFQALGVLLLVLCSQETSFYRSNTSSFPSKSEIETIIPNIQQSNLSAYLRSMHPLPYYNPPSMSLLIQLLRRIVTPTAALLFLMSSLLPAIAFSIGNSLPLLYSTLSMMLFSTKIGYIFTLPLILVLLTHFLTSSLFITTSPTYNLPTRILSLATNSLVYAPTPKTSPKKSFFIIIPGLLIGVSGLIAFGLYNSFHTRMITASSGTLGKVNHTMATGDSSMSFQIVSLFFGFAVAGGLMLQLSASAYLTASTSPTSRAVVNAETSLHFYRNILAGCLVMGLPNWLMRPKAFLVTFGVVGGMQVLVAVLAVVGLCVFDGLVEMGDTLVLGTDESQDEQERNWEGQESFMEL